MTSIDYAARLALVQSAINGILNLGMQSYDLGGQQVTQLDVAWLSREEERLIARMNRQNRRGGAFRQASPR